MQPRCLTLICIPRWHFSLLPGHVTHFLCNPSSPPEPESGSLKFPTWILILNDFAFTIGIIYYSWAIPVHNIFTLQNKILQYCSISLFIKKGYLIDINCFMFSLNFPENQLVGLRIWGLGVRVLSPAPFIPAYFSITLIVIVSTVKSPGLWPLNVIWMLRLRSGKQIRELQSIFEKCR